MACANESSTVLGEFIGGSKVSVRVMLWVDFGQHSR